jgi:bacteriocin biosynthesis cyclodehydratase domain-containing protein
MTPERNLPTRPCLKPWYRLAQTNGRLILEYAQAKVVLEGRAVQQLMPVLLPLVDGTRTVEEIGASLGENAKPAVDNALAVLDQHGLLTDGPAGPDAAEPAGATAEFLTATAGDGSGAGEAADAIAGATAAVVGCGGLAAATARQLRRAGLGNAEILDWSSDPGTLEGLDLAVVAPDPGELPELRDFNEAALRLRLPWLQVLPFDGRVAAVGPLYVPDETCCYECFRRRRRANLRWEEGDDEALEATAAAYPAPEPLTEMLAGSAAMVAVDWLYRRSRGELATAWAGSANLIRWDAGLEMSRHRVYRVPRCPACFADDRGSASPWHG